jgi:hypothetical protein
MEELEEVQLQQQLGAAEVDQELHRHLAMG